jgi:tRNA 2-selenouridine synthase
MPAAISAPEALRLLLEKGRSVRAVDVRSEGEFAQAAVPGFVNLPILRDPERAEVGTCYKQKGPSEAIDLGHRLVAASREARIAEWKRALEGAEYPLLACFRGGLRSEIASSWVEQNGAKVIKVHGGYKQMRRELMRALERLPDFFVLAGPTGSGKTRLLRDAGAPHLDLERLANHRGSAFGGSLLAPQPSQATFENHVGFALLGASSPLLVEDESPMIGQVCLPGDLQSKIKSSPVVRIRMGLEERAELLCREYVVEPLAQGVPAPALLAHYQGALRKIERKLGGLAAGEVAGKLARAFSRSGAAQAEPEAQDPEAHMNWIRDLLSLYYDKAYEYSFQKIPRATAFEGDWNACKQWIREKFA